MLSYYIYIFRVVFRLGRADIHVIILVAYLIVLIFQALWSLRWLLGTHWGWRVLVGERWRGKWITITAVGFCYKMKNDEWVIDWLMNDNDFSFERDWLRTDLNVIGFGLIGWLAPSSIPAINGKSLTGLFFESIGTELAHFPTPPPLTSQFWSVHFFD